MWTEASGARAGPGAPSARRPTSGRASHELRPADSELRNQTPHDTRGKAEDVTSQSECSKPVTEKPRQDQSEDRRARGAMAICHTDGAREESGGRHQSLEEERPLS